MPEGTKGWTEMKTGDSEGAGQKPLSGQEPPCRKRARRMGGAARAGSRMSPEARGPGQVPGCPQMRGVQAGMAQSHSPGEPLEWARETPASQRELITACKFVSAIIETTGNTPSRKWLGLRSSCDVCTT